jgi:hypothetical protein
MRFIEKARKRVAGFFWAHFVSDAQAHVLCMRAACCVLRDDVAAVAAAAADAACCTIGEMLWEADRTTVDM